MAGGFYPIFSTSMGRLAPLATYSTSFCVVMFITVVALFSITISAVEQPNHIYIANARIQSNHLAHTLNVHHHTSTHIKPLHFAHRTSTLSATGRHRDVLPDRLNAYPHQRHIIELQSPDSPSLNRRITLSIPSHTLIEDTTITNDNTPNNFLDNVSNEDEIRQWLVQIKGPITQEKKDVLNGIISPYTLGDYIPENTFKVHAPVFVINNILPDHLLTTEQLIKRRDFESRARFSNYRELQAARGYIVLITEYHPVFKLSANTHVLRTTYNNQFRDITSFNRHSSLHTQFSTFRLDSEGMDQSVNSQLTTQSQTPPLTTPLRDKKINLRIDPSNNSTDGKEKQITLLVHIINPTESPTQAKLISNELILSLVNQWQEERNLHLETNEAYRNHDSFTTLPDTHPLEYISIQLSNSEKTLLSVTSHMLTTDRGDVSKLTARTWLLIKLLSEHPLVEFIEQRPTHRILNHYANSIIQSDIYPLMTTLDMLNVTKNSRTVSSNPFSNEVNNIHNTLFNSFSSTPAWDHGIIGKGSIVAVADTGVDHDHCYYYDPNTKVPLNTFNRNHRKIVAYYTSEQVQPRDTNPNDQVNGHGTFVSGTVVGAPPDSAPAEMRKHRGLVYGAKLAFFDYQHSSAKADEMVLPDDVYNDYLYRAMNQFGVTVTANSWGDITGVMDNFARSVDRFMYHYPHFVNVFACGNTGLLGKLTIASPALSKNVIAVGSTSNSPLSWYERNASAGLKVLNLITSKNNIPRHIYVRPAEFGVKFNSLKKHTKMLLIKAEPAHACTSLTNTPLSNILSHITELRANANTTAENDLSYLLFESVMIITKRGTCSFAQKAQTVQAYGAAVMIVVNNDEKDDGVDVMNVSPTSSVKPSAYDKLSSVMMQASFGDKLLQTLPSTYDSNNLFNNMIVEAPTAYVLKDQNEYRLSSFSSRGPTKDGRLKPDIVAPGEYIVSARSDGDLNTFQCDPGSALTPMQGTSMAAPVVSAAAVMIREYLMKGFYPTGKLHNEHGVWDYLPTHLYPEDPTGSELLNIPTSNGINVATASSAPPSNTNTNTNTNTGFFGSIANIARNLVIGSNVSNNNDLNTNTIKKLDKRYSFQPSSALVKALIIHSGITVGGPVETEINDKTLYEAVTPPPSIYQGFGRIQLTNVLFFNDTLDEYMFKQNQAKYKQTFGQIFGEKLTEQKRLQSFMYSKPSMFMLDYQEHVKERWYGGVSSLAKVDTLDYHTFCFDLNDIIENIYYLKYNQPTNAASSAGTTTTLNDNHPFRQWAIAQSDWNVENNQEPLITPQLHAYSYGFSHFADPFVKISLVWTDPPAALSASKLLVNDIDLSATIIANKKDPKNTSTLVSKVKSIFIGNEYADNGGNKWDNLDLANFVDSSIMTTIDVDLNPLADHNDADEMDNIQFFNNTFFTPEDFTIKKIRNNNNLNNFNDKAFDNLNNVEQIFISSQDLLDITSPIYQEANTRNNNYKIHQKMTQLHEYLLSVNIHGKSIPMGPQAFALTISTLHNGVLTEKRLLPTKCHIAAQQTPPVNTQQTSISIGHNNIIVDKITTNNPNINEIHANTIKIPQHITSFINPFNCLNGCNNNGVCVTAHVDPIQIYSTPDSSSSSSQNQPQYITSSALQQPTLLTDFTPVSSLYSSYSQYLVSTDTTNNNNANTLNFHQRFTTYGCYCYNDWAGSDCSIKSTPIPLYTPTVASQFLTQFDIAKVYDPSTFNTPTQYDTNNKPQHNTPLALTINPDISTYHYVYFPPLSQRPPTGQYNPKTDGIYINMVRKYHQGDVDMFALLPTSSQPKNNQIILSPLSIPEYSFATGGYPSERYYTFKANTPDNVFNEMIYTSVDDIQIPYNIHNPATPEAYKRKLHRNPTQISTTPKVRVINQLFIPWMMLSSQSSPLHDDGYIKVMLKGLCCDVSDVQLIAHYTYTPTVNNNNQLSFIYPFHAYNTKVLFSTNPAPQSDVLPKLSNQNQLFALYSKLSAITLTQQSLQQFGPADSPNSVYYIPSAPTSSTTTSSLTQSLVDIGTITTLPVHKAITPSVTQSLTNKNNLNDLLALYKTNKSGDLQQYKRKIQDYITASLPHSIELSPLPMLATKNTDKNNTINITTFITEKEVASLQYSFAQVPNNNNINNNIAPNILQQYFKTTSSGIRTRLTLTTNINRLPENFNQIVAHEVASVLGIEDQPCRVQVLEILRIQVAVSPTNSPTSGTASITSPNPDDPNPITGSKIDNYVELLSNNQNNPQHHNTSPMRTFQASNPASNAPMKTVLAIDILLLPPLSLNALFQTTSHINVFDYQSVQNYNDLLELQRYLLSLHQTCDGRIATVQNKYKSYNKQRQGGLDIDLIPSTSSNNSVNILNDDNILNVQQLYLNLLNAFTLAMPSAQFAVFGNNVPSNAASASTGATMHTMAMPAVLPLSTLVLGYVDATIQPPLQYTTVQLCALGNFNTTCSTQHGNPNWSTPSRLYNPFYAIATSIVSSLEKASSSTSNTRIFTPYQHSSSRPAPHIDDQNLQILEQEPQTITHIRNPEKVSEMDIKLPSTNSKFFIPPQIDQDIDRKRNEHVSTVEATPINSPNVINTQPNIPSTNIPQTTSPTPPSTTTATTWNKSNDIKNDIVPLLVLIVLAMSCLSIILVKQLYHRHRYKNYHVLSPSKPINPDNDSHIHTDIIVDDDLDDLYHNISYHQQFQQQLDNVPSNFNNINQLPIHDIPQNLTTSNGPKHIGRMTDHLNLTEDDEDELAKYSLE